jgi:hypothetical protein
MVIFRPPRTQNSARPKEKQALAARDLALKLGNYANDRMRIEYHPGPPHGNDVWWTA